MTDILFPIPSGWHRVETGEVKEGDMFWDGRGERWETVENRDLVGQNVIIFYCVIRKEEKESESS